MNKPPENNKKFVSRQCSKISIQSLSPIPPNPHLCLHSYTSAVPPVSYPFSCYDSTDQRRWEQISRKVLGSSASVKKLASSIMHPPLTIHRHPMCAEIIEQFQKCHIDHRLGKFFGECTDLKIKLDKCFRQEKSLRRKANFEESKKLKERLREYRKENLEIRDRRPLSKLNVQTMKFSM